MSNSSNSWATTTGPPNASEASWAIAVAIVRRPHVHQRERARAGVLRELARLGCGHVRRGAGVLLGQGRLGEEQVDPDRRAQRRASPGAVSDV